MQARGKKRFMGTMVEGLERRVLMAAPANDLFANAEPIDAADLVGGESNHWLVTDTNVDATSEAGEPPYYAGGRSIWYRWQAPADGGFSVQTFGSSFNTTLAIYEGLTLADLMFAAGGDDSDGTVQSRTVLRAYEGCVYWIRVDGSSGAMGTVVLGIAPNRAPTAISITTSAVAEDQPIGTVVGRLSTADPDRGEWFNYEFVSGPGDADNHLFTAGGQLLTAATFDYETRNSYSVRVRAYDSGCLTVEQAIQITIVQAATARQVGHWGGLIKATAPYEGFALMSQGQDLVVLDASAPASLAEVGRVRLPDVIEDIHVAGSYAYVAADESGLQIVDMSNPSAPSLVGSFDTREAAGVSVAGAYAYVADTFDGLVIIDVSNPAAPARVGGWSGGLALDVSVAGGYGFVASGYSGINVLDVSSPAAPVRVGGYNTPSYAEDVSVAGGYAYVADSSNGLVVLNISNPSAPSLAGGYDTQCAFGLSIVGSLAYIADASAGLRIINVSNPAAPTLVGTYNTPDSALNISVSGGYAFVADASSLQVIRVSTPASPAKAGESKSLGYVGTLAIAGAYAYAPTGTGGVTVLDLSQPATPVRVGGYDTAGSAVAAVVSGSSLYVADGSSGLQVLNIANPTSPTRVGGYDTPGSAQGLAVAGGYAYVADGTAGLQIVDVRNPAAPTRAGTSATAGYAMYAVTVSGSYAYVADGSGGFRILNVSNPALPVQVSAYADQYSDVRDVNVVGSSAYVLDFYRGLLVFDISSPASPRLVSETPTGDGAEHLSMAGQYAYVSAGFRGIRIVDLNNAVGPVCAGGYQVPNSAESVSVVGEYIYAGDESNGLVVARHGQDAIAPAISSTSINGGAAQRSMVKQLGVTFSEAVTLLAGAVNVVLKTGAAVPNTTVSVTNPSGDGKTWVVTFGGTGVTGGSLADGVYDLVVEGTKVQDLAGNVMVGSYTQRFHRLFGDSNGDGRVNLVDYRAMRVTSGKSSGQGLFNEALDYDGGGVVNVMDLTQFRRRFGMRV